MPFSPDVKARMFIRCARHCCLCLKQCGTNIEVDHIVPESEGGSNEEDNGIPLCFDCHQEAKAYNDNHPRGNKIRSVELRSRRDNAYELVESGRIYNTAEREIYLEGVEIRGGDGRVGAGGDAKVTGGAGQGVRMIGGSIIGGNGGDGGGGGDASLENNSVSQVAVNSPGAIQALGDVTVHHHNPLPSLILLGAEGDGGGTGIFGQRAVLLFGANPASALVKAVVEIESDGTIESFQKAVVGHGMVQDTTFIGPSLDANQNRFVWGQAVLNVGNSMRIELHSREALGQIRYGVHIG